MPRMRTATHVMDEIRAQDPATEVTLHYVRSLINTNKVPVVMVGRKKLVDVDKVLAVLAAGETQPEPKTTVGQIRRVIV